MFAAVLECAAAVDVDADAPGQRAASTRFLMCWDPNEQGNWIRKKDLVSIKENYGANRLGELSAAILDKEYAEHGINLR